MYVDVHTHLTHPRFSNDLTEVISRAKMAGLVSIVVNGLEPISNRMILEMSHNFQIIKPALGIYPIEAINDLLPGDFKLNVERFDVSSEIEFIRTEAGQGHLVAIGECGLDGYWVGEETFTRQEEVFEKLLQVALQNNLPVIVHSRKREERAMAILKNMGMKKAVLHCFGGRVNLAKSAAEEHGWYLSIPANAGVNEAFRKMLQVLPLERILTETDAPYLSPKKGTRNEPVNVVGTINLLAELREISQEKAKEIVYNNFRQLFGDI